MILGLRPTCQNVAALDQITIKHVKKRGDRMKIQSQTPLQLCLSRKTSHSMTRRTNKRKSISLIIINWIRIGETTQILVHTVLIIVKEFCTHPPNFTRYKMDVWEELKWSNKILKLFCFTYGLSALSVTASDWKHPIRKNENSQNVPNEFYRACSVQVGIANRVFFEETWITPQYGLQKVVHCDCQGGLSNPSKERVSELSSWSRYAIDVWCQLYVLASQDPRLVQGKSNV